MLPGGESTAGGAAQQKTGCPEHPISQHQAMLFSSTDLLCVGGRPRKHQRIQLFLWAAAKTYQLQPHKYMHTQTQTQPTHTPTHTHTQKVRLNSCCSSHRRTTLAALPRSKVFSRRNKNWSRRSCQCRKTACGFTLRYSLGSPSEAAKLEFGLVLPVCLFVRVFVCLFVHLCGCVRVWCTRVCVVCAVKTKKRSGPSMMSTARELRRREGKKRLPPPNRFIDVRFAPHPASARVLTLMSVTPSPRPASHSMRVRLAARDTKRSERKASYSHENSRDVKFSPHPAIASAWALASVTPSLRPAFTKSNKNRVRQRKEMTKQQKAVARASEPTAKTQ